MARRVALRDAAETQIRLDFIPAFGVAWNKAATNHLAADRIKDTISHLRIPPPPPQWLRPPTAPYERGIRGCVFVSIGNVGTSHRIGKIQDGAALRLGRDAGIAPTAGSLW